MNAAALLLVLLAAAEGGEPLSVGVLPAGGNAPAPLRAKATEAIVTALRGIPTLKVIAMSDVAGLLGPGASESLAACGDDACRADVVKALGAQRLVVAELFQAPGGMSLEARLVDPATPLSPVVRVSRDVRSEGAVSESAAKAAADLFPDRAAQGSGTLIVEASPSGAAIFVDGAAAATSPAPPLKVSAGRHTVRATARGHRPSETSVDVPLGGSARSYLDLEKRRSKWPLVLGGGAVAAAGAGIVFGALAQSKASSWTDACGAGPCGSGFTRERYDADAGTVSLERGLANGLIGAGAALAVGAVVWFFVDPGKEEAGE